MFQFLKGSKTIRRSAWTFHNSVHKFTFIITPARTWYEPRHEKTCLRGLRPVKTQTSLLSHRGKLEAWNFGYRKRRHFTIQAANYKDADQTDLVNISTTFHEDILKGFQATEQTALYSVLGIAKVQRSITKKIYIQELLFLHSAHRLMLVNNSTTFQEDILNGFQATERTALYSVLGIAKVRRGITQKMYIQELWFLWSAHRLMLVNISMTFHEVILSVFQVTEQTALYSWRFSRMILCQQGDYRAHYVNRFRSLLRAVQCWIKS